MDSRESPAVTDGRRVSRIALAGPLLAGLLAVAAACGGPLDDYTIRAVELRSAPQLEFLRARVGMKFLEVRFELQNDSGDPLEVKALDFSLRDASGTLHPFSAQVLDLGQPRGQPEAVVLKGATQAGSVVFQIPEDAVPTELIYRQELDGGLVVKLLSGG